MYRGMEQLPGMSDRELLEGMTPDQLYDLIQEDGLRASEIERRMSMASDVLDGYGTSVDEIFAQREREKHGDTQVSSS